MLRSSLFGLLSALQFPDAPQLLQAAVAGKNKILCTLFLKTNEAYRSGNGITAVGRGGGFRTNATLQALEIEVLVAPSGLQSCWAAAQQACYELL